MSTNVSTTEKPDETAMAERAPQARVYRPLTDIIETGEGVSLMLEIPGVNPDDVDISLERRVLTIRAMARAAHPEGADLVHAEYGEGDYERAFTLSEDLDPDRISAEIRNGVLTITLPRAPERQPQKIAVKAK